MFAPIPFNEEARLDAMKCINRFEFDNDDRLNQITHWVAHKFQTPFVYLPVIEKKTSYFISSFGSDIKEMPRKCGICSHVIAEVSSTLSKERIYVIQDTLRNEKFVNNSLVTSQPTIRSYLGYVLQTKNGFNLGTLCIMDVVPRTFKDEEIFDFMVIGELANKILLSET